MEVLIWTKRKLSFIIENSKINKGENEIMPYCPKCDMEFIEGITVCSDCGEPLVESKEAAAAMKKQEQEIEAARQAAEESGEWAVNPDGYNNTDADKGTPPPVARVYVTKARQYDDLKSSATAFFLIGGIMVVGSILCWLSLIKLPFAGNSRMLSQGVMTVLGLVFLYIGFTSDKSAKVVHDQIGKEEMATWQLVEWFAGSYSADELDQRIVQDYGELSPEEHSLKRFGLIEDILITNHDIANQSYVDSLVEEIYTKVFPD